MTKGITDREMDERMDEGMEERMDGQEECECDFFSPPFFFLLFLSFFPLFSSSCIHSLDVVIIYHHHLSELPQPSQFPILPSHHPPLHPSAVAAAAVATVDSSSLRTIPRN